MEEHDTSNTEGCERMSAKETGVEDSIAAAARRLCDLPPVINDAGAGATVAFGRGDGFTDRVYCGRGGTGRAGTCGPNNGRQCSSCRSLQNSFKKVQLLRLRFPTTTTGTRQAGKNDDDLSIYFVALRHSGGRFASAANHLRQLGMPELEARFALPTEGDGEDPLVTQLMDTFSVTRPMAEVALLQHNNDAELAATWILDHPRAVREQAAENHHRAQTTSAAETHRERLEAMRALLEMEVPEELSRLAAGAPYFPLLEERREMDAGGFFVAQGQHFMAKPSPHSGDEENDESTDDSLQRRPYCTYCGGKIPSNYCGSYVCQNCNLCEGCVVDTVTYQCPRLANGGHVHHHPLTLEWDRSESNATCDVRYGGGDCERHSCLWTCRQCDFDACHDCMRVAEPEGYDRRAMTVVRTENTTTDDATTEPHFDEVTAEREAAARWEGSYQDTSPAEVIVGTGVVGTTSPEQRAGVSPRRDGTNNRVALRTYRESALLTETGLSEEAQAAFHRFKDDSGASFPKVAAADLTHVEDILQRSRVVDDKLTSRTICEAIAAGRLEIGGTLLLSQAFAPILLGNAGTEESTSSDEAMVCCVCADKIDVRTAPDGAVGCLGGHAMHASCAADLLLGGGQCPACRQPLFFPRISDREAQSAVEMAKAELSRMQREEEERRQQELLDLSDRGLKPTLSIGDVVRVSSDAEQCKKFQTGDPRTGGWHKEMAEECGQDCCITDIIENDKGNVVAFRVRSLLRNKHRLVSFRAHGSRCPQCQNRGPSSRTGCKRCTVCAACQKCCSSAAGSFCDGSNQRWIWHPSLLTLVRRAGHAAVGDEACVDKEEAVAKAGENHLIRLRAELAAVKAAREEIKASMDKKIIPLKSSISRNLSAASGATVQHLTDTVSPADWHRARHLLLLAQDWGDSDEAKGERATLYAAVRAGDLDSVARSVRRYNARRTIEEATWSNAVAETHEYIVGPTAKVDLRAFPAVGAPKTGYSLDPSTRFVSKREVLDIRGNMWLQVAETSFLDQTQLDGEVTFDGKDSIKILGARVVRGRQWRHGDQDGGEGSEGTIVVAKDPGWVSVRWDNIKTAPLRYRVGSNNCFELNFAKSRPPAQGWLSFRPGGPGSPAIATLARSPCRCFSCGDGLVSPRLGKERFTTAKGSSLQVGDHLFVAATLEPVKVYKISSDRVYCSFLTERTKNEVAGESRKKDDDSNQNLVWYRHEDLVLPKGQKDNHVDDDAVLVNGEWRTRRELVLLHGRDEAAARKVWDAVTKRDSSATTFASCARGHLLHARCLQGALIAGRSCPAPGCTEPLWVPRVKREADAADGTFCRGGSEDSNAEAEALQAAAEVAGHAALVATLASEGGQPVEDFRSAGLSTLKMCPACCAGPLFNDNCADMRTHHGQCSVLALRGSSGTPCTPDGPFRVPASEIAAKMMQLSGNQAVADVLPRCPGHNVLVMFNGCMSCGYLFTDTDWNTMPKWDPNAKKMLELDKKKRKAAVLLAEQIRTEAALLQFERDALWRQRNEGRAGIISQTNPPPAPSIPAYQVNVQQNPNTVPDMFADDGGGDY